MRILRIITFILPLIFFSNLYSQGFPDYDGGMKVKLNEDGSKYFRIIAWGQFWAQYNDNVPEDEPDLNFSIRRARVLMYSQLSDKFLLLAHFGLNGLNATNLSPTGKDDDSELFFHDFWGEFKLAKNHSIGAGLHYWNGISRLNNQSTLNLLTLDNNRPSWATLGLSDQFARHLGVYLKGSFNKFQYRLAVNDALENTLDTRDASATQAVYRGRELIGKDASRVYQGYLEYNFLDKESNFLPFKVGTYLGTKKVFNVGAGFFLHPDGVVKTNGAGELEGENVSILALDAFYESPINEKGDAISAYATFQNNDYGDNYNLGPYATGNMIYSHVGYFNKKTKLQPYVSYQTRKIDAINDNANRFGIGANYFMSGHHAKISAEYSNEKIGNADATGLFTIQAMIYL